MDYNPIKYIFPATLLQWDGDDGILNVQNGVHQSQARMHRSLLPDGITPGQSFHLHVKNEETAQKGTYKTMKKLLEDLIQ